MNIDISNAFNSLCRALTLDGKATRDYACGIKANEDLESACDSLRPMFDFFHGMRTCESKIRNFDCNGDVHTVKGKTGGQQGDPLEMIVYELSTHP